MPHAVPHNIRAGTTGAFGFSGFLALLPRQFLSCIRHRQGRNTELNVAQAISEKIYHI